VLQPFLFSFGFETPAERRSNDSAGTDFESSWSVWIDAESSGAAMEWGRQVAEAFVRELYERAGIETHSWTAGAFAHWIESDAPRDESSPSVVIGEMPDFAPILRRFADR
jgi:hypothetical protein